MKYRVFVFSGRDLAALEDDYAPALMYEKLTWEEAVELCKMSFLQGYGCVLWQIEEAVGNG